MSPLESVLLILALGLPVHFLVIHQMNKLSDPAYLREEGVVIVLEAALQAHSEPVGRYQGRPIWGSVTFMGMLYRYDRVVPRSYRWRIRSRELFLEPGLVYVTD